MSEPETERMPDALPVLVQDYAPVGDLTPIELQWRERHHAYPTLNWRVAGRDVRGNLVCWTVLPAGRNAKFEWVCISTLEPGGVTYTSAKQPIPDEDR